MLRFELVRDVGRFQEIAADWQTLWARSGASIFQSHLWISATLGGHRDKFQLHIGIVWQDDGTLVAAVPCRVGTVRGMRVLEWMAHEVSDYCDGIGDLPNLETCWTKMVAGRGFDIVHLANLRPDAAIVAFLRRDRIETKDSDTCFTLISRWPTGDAWMEAQYPKKRNVYSRGLRKLEETGRVEIQFHTQPPEGVVDKLRDLKRKWAIAFGVPAPFVEDDGLLVDLVDAMAATGNLLLAIIKCDGNIVAGAINALHGGRVLSWFTVYDRDYDRASPGIILLTECIRWGWDSGFTEHDHMRGAHPYKLPYSNASVVLRRYTAPRSLRGYVALSIRGAIRAVRRIRQTNGSRLSPHD